MTRLTPEKVKNIPTKLLDYEQELMKKTENSLIGIAKHALKVRNDITSVLSKTTAAIIPITAGEGTIIGFAEAVLAILTHIGIDTYITEKTDVEGFAEAISKQTDVLFIADDNLFIAVNLRTRYVSNNSICTGKAYVAALDLAIRGVKDKPVLVIGYGPVGQAATIELLDRLMQPQCQTLFQKR
jgi:pyrrolysine biosynthesis protein PylD